MGATAQANVAVFPMAPQQTEASAGAGGFYRCPRSIAVWLPRAGQIIGTAQAAGPQCDRRNHCVGALEELKTVANRLTVKVLVIPQDSMFDKLLDVLKTDTAVRMDPPNDLGDLQYPAGSRQRRSPPQSRHMPIPITGRWTPTPPTLSRPKCSLANTFPPGWK